MFRRHLLALWVPLVSCLAVAAHAGERRKPITHPKYDPAAPRVELFDGLDGRSLEAELRPKNEFGGNVFIRNLTDKAITVVLPEAIVGIHVHPQNPFGNNNFGNNAGTGQQGAGQGMGQNQAVGGQMGQNSAGIGVGQGQQGFFSIPAAATVRLPFESVCLEHGKTTPDSRNSYKLVRPESYSDKPELTAIARAIADGKTDRAVIQAAAWHIASEMSWDQLAAKTFDRAAAADTAYFSKSQLKAARDLVERAVTQSPKTAPASTAATAKPATLKPVEIRSANPR
jgi:hypothetical protein